MKKLSTLLIICILSAIVLSSCGTGRSITKRRYTKGYYVNKTPKHHETKEALAIKTTKHAAPMPVQVLTELKKETQEASVETTGTENNITANVIKDSKKEKKTSAAKPLKHAFVDFSIRKPFKTIDKAIENHKLSAGSEDGLSLFWIVILVILILWALGFISGNFGGIINLLLIIALILLILWLLRVL